MFSVCNTSLSSKSILPLLSLEEKKILLSFLFFLSSVPFQGRTVCNVSLLLSLSHLCQAAVKITSHLFFSRWALLVKVLIYIRMCQPDEDALISSSQVFLHLYVNHFCSATCESVWLSNRPSPIYVYQDFSREIVCAAGTAILFCLSVNSEISDS